MKPSESIVTPAGAVAVAHDASGGDGWSDARLVRECLHGHDEAWSALLVKYKRLIYSIPIKYGFTADEAADIFQEVCVELLSELPRLREPRALPQWLIRVTSHKCLRLKREQQQTRSTEVSEGAMEAVADAGPTDAIVHEVEREQALRDAIAALPARCQALVRSLFFESPPRPYREIADGLGIACGSIGFIRGRCLQRLRRELQRQGFR